MDYQHESFGQLFTSSSSDRPHHEKQKLFCVAVEEEAVRGLKGGAVPLDERPGRLPSRRLQPRPSSGPGTPPSPYRGLS